MDFGNRQATGIWPENNSGEEIAEKSAQDDKL